MSEPAEQITARVLGCGSSGGVPRIGNVWGACDPDNPKNRRRRCSLLIEGRRASGEGMTRIIIDTGCDLREQLLDAEIGTVDAVLYTHAHADHIHGIDDLRMLAMNANNRVPVYYDSLIAKLIVWGPDRDASRQGMIEALKAFQIGGVKTTIPVHLKIMEDPDFAAGNYDTGFMARLLGEAKDEKMTAGQA